MPRLFNACALPGANATTPPEQALRVARLPGGEPNAPQCDHRGLRFAVQCQSPAVAFSGSIVAFQDREHFALLDQGFNVVRISLKEASGNGQSRLRQTALKCRVRHVQAGAAADQMDRARCLDLQARTAAAGGKCQDARQHGDADHFERFLYLR